VAVSTFVADVSIAEVCVRLPTALVIADIDEVSVGREVTLPVKLSGGVNVGNAVGNVPVVGNGEWKPPNISSWNGLEFVSEVEAVVFLSGVTEGKLVDRENVSDKAVAEKFVPLCPSVDAAVPTPALDPVATSLKKVFVVRSGSGVAASVVPAVRVVVGDGMRDVRFELAVAPNVTAGRDPVAFCKADVRFAAIVGRDKDEGVLISKTSSATALSAGLISPRGTSVVNSLGRTSSAVGKVAIAVVWALSAGASTSRLCVCLIQ